MFKVLMYMFLTLVLVHNKSFAQNIQNWQEDIHKIYNGQVVYTPKAFLDMYNKLDKNDVIARSAWGMMVAQSIFSDPSIDSSDFEKLQKNLIEIYHQNRKLSDLKNSDEELYMAGRFGFYLLGLSTFYKFPSASFYDIYIEYRSLLKAVIQKDKRFVNEAQVILVDGLSRPANKSTNNWNSYILSVTDSSKIATLPKDIQYRALLARARVLAKKDRIKEAQQTVNQAIEIYPNGSSEGVLLSLSIQ